MQLALHQLFQILIAHFFLIVHIQGELTAIGTGKFTSQRTCEWALFLLGPKTFKESLLDRVSFFLLLLRISFLQCEASGTLLTLLSDVVIISKGCELNRDSALVVLTKI